MNFTVAINGVTTCVTSFVATAMTMPRATSDPMPTPAPTATPLAASTGR